MHNADEKWHIYCVWYWWCCLSVVPELEWLRWCNSSRVSMHNSAADLIAVLIARRPERADRWPLLQPESRWRLTSRTKNGSSLPTPQAPACRCSRGAFFDREEEGKGGWQSAVPAFTGQAAPSVAVIARWRALWGEWCLKSSVERMTVGASAQVEQTSHPVYYQLRPTHFLHSHSLSTVHSKPTVTDNISFNPE